MCRLRLPRAASHSARDPPAAGLSLPHSGGESRRHRRRDGHRTAHLRGARGGKQSARPPAGRARLHRRGPGRSLRAEDPCRDRGDARRPQGRRHLRAPRHRQPGRPGRPDDSRHGAEGDRRGAGSRAVPRLARAGGRPAAGRVRPRRADPGRACGERRHGRGRRGPRQRAPGAPGAGGRARAPAVHLRFHRRAEGGPTSESARATATPARPRCTSTSPRSTSTAPSRPAPSCTSCRRR
jgi:translation initiation factor IF-2